MIDLLKKTVEKGVIPADSQVVTAALQRVDKQTPGFLKKIGGFAARLGLAVGTSGTGNWMYDAIKEASEAVEEE